MGLSKKMNKVKKKLTCLVRASSFIGAQLFQQDDISHTATGSRPPTTQRRLISEAYNCSSHVVNLAVLTSFLVKTESLSP